VRPLVVLAIEDEAVRAACAYALAAAEFDVTTIDAPTAWPGDASRVVVVADVSAESESGWRLVAELKRRDAACGIPIVVLAADTGPKTRARARRERCAAIVAKTCPPNLLASGIRAVLARNAARETGSLNLL